MKASIITLQSVYNYGTQLQAYATQKKMEQYFDEVEFINYRRPDTYGKGLIATFSKSNPVRFLAFMPTYFVWKRKFGKFQKKRLKINPTEYEDAKDFEKYDDESDVYFSGSDQVWNTGWNGGIIPQFYLNFVPEGKPKYAYSSSFGKEKLSNKEIPEIKRLLSRYDGITVREKSGLRIIESQLKIKGAQQLNDPTLAYDGDWWRRLKRKNCIKGKYILIYNLNNNPDFDRYAEEVSRKTGLKLYRFCTRFDQMRKNGKSILIPNVEDFITYVDDAELVITDSFHAVAFSANLNTDFIALLPKKYASRLTDFSDSVGANDRIARNYADFSPLSRRGDFSRINKVLEKRRKEYDDYLKMVKGALKDE